MSNNTMISGKVALCPLRFYIFGLHTLISLLQPLNIKTLTVPTIKFFSTKIARL